MSQQLPELDEPLSDQERQTLDQLAKWRRLSRNTNHEFDSTTTFGQRVADRVAAFGGSWAFILLFMGILISWIVLNTVVLARTQSAFDPYPFILLNLVLSMVAALQAPFIMMAQNRQAAKDRLDAAHDYEVNLKAEIEILRLHQKLDTLREPQWAALIALQQEQLHLLQRLVAQHEGKR